MRLLSCVCSTVPIAGRSSMPLLIVSTRSGREGLISRLVNLLAPRYASCNPVLPSSCSHVVSRAAREPQGSSCYLECGVLFVNTSLGLPENALRGSDLKLGGDWRICSLSISKLASGAVSYNLFSVCWMKSPVPRSYAGHWR